jgi:hypothetical protein
MIVQWWANGALATTPLAVACDLRFRRYSIESASKCSRVTDAPESPRRLPVRISSQPEQRPDSGAWHD